MKIRVLLALAVLSSTAHAVEVPIEYVVDSKTLKQAIAGTSISIAVHGTEDCSGVPLQSTAANIEDFDSIEALKPFSPKGATKAPKFSRLRATVDVPPAGNLFVVMSGTGISAVGSTCQAQTATAVSRCSGPIATAGNATEFPDSGIFAANFLRGQAVSVASPGGVLCSLGLIAKSAGANVRLALYTQAPGLHPGELLAETASTPVVVGPQELPVLVPLTLPPGTYWLMSVVDSTVNVGVNAGDPVSTHFRAQTYTSFLSNPYVPDSVFGGARANLYLKIAQ